MLKLGLYFVFLLSQKFGRTKKNFLIILNLIKRFGFVMECFLHSNFKNKRRNVQQEFNRSNTKNTQKIIYDFRRNSISSENTLFYKENIK